MFLLLFSGLVLVSQNALATDAHLDYDGWEWHYDDAAPAILTRVVQTGATTEITIPANLDGSTPLTIIGANCFNDNEGHKITRVLSMPVTVTSLGQEAIANCALLTSVNVGMSGLVSTGYYGIIMTSIPSLSVDIGYSYLYSCYANQSVIWTITTNASWLSINNNTVSGICNALDVGSYYVHINGTNTNGSVYQNYTVSVMIPTAFDIGPIIWFVALMFMIIFNIIGFKYITFLMILSMVFTLIIAVPAILAFSEYGTVAAVIVIMNVCFSAFGIIKMRKHRT